MLEKTLTTRRYFELHGAPQVKPKVAKTRNANGRFAKKPKRQRKTKDKAAAQPSPTATEQPAPVAASTPEVVAKVQPWKAEGISRAAYYRRKKKAVQAASGIVQPEKPRRMTKAEQAAIFGHRNVQHMNSVMRRNKASRQRA